MTEAQTIEDSIQTAEYSVPIENKIFLSDEEKETIKKLHRKVGSFFKGKTKNGELTRYSPNTMAKSIMEIFEIVTLMDTEEIYRYNLQNGKWQNDGINLVKHTIEKILVSEATKYRKIDAIDSLKCLTWGKRNFLSPPKNEICLKNGVL